MFPSGASAWQRHQQQQQGSSAEELLTVVDGDALLSPSSLAQTLDGADTLYCALTPHRL
jgi:hypothetical protein